MKVIRDITTSILHFFPDGQFIGLSSSSSPLQVTSSENISLPGTLLCPFKSATGVELLDLPAPSGPLSSILDSGIFYYTVSFAARVPLGMDFRSKFNCQDSYGVGGESPDCWPNVLLKRTRKLLGIANSTEVSKQ